MASILITPENKTELIFLSNHLKKLKVDSPSLSKEDKEDIGLRILMKKADKKNCFTKYYHEKAEN